MKIYRPLWNEGVLLSPQQFQQQAHWEAFTNAGIAALAHPLSWGIETVALNEGLLSTGRLQVVQLRLWLPDGTLVAVPDSDITPAVRDLTPDVPADVDRVTVFVALPLFQPGISNVQAVGEKAHRPLKYRQEWITLQDDFGMEEESMSVAWHNLSLRLDVENNEEYQVCPVARVVRDGQGGWRSDPLFIPPMAKFSACPALHERLVLVNRQIQSRRQRLMSMRRESNERLADFAVADVSLFWLLNALNSHARVLTEFEQHPVRHPEPVWAELARLAGSLLTFSLDHDIHAIPGYDHGNPEQTFPPLFDLVSELLDASLPSRVVALQMERIDGQNWKTTLHDMRLREEADFYLSVRSTLPGWQLAERFPALCKAGAPDDVNSLVNVALTGVPLLAINRVPAALPVRLENQYFALDMAHHAAREMLESGVCMFYVPSLLGDIELELFAVLRS
ncbi:type VI secretion system baseplate subunit TssK [Salmonella enterica subsp. enterica]